MVRGRHHPRDHWYSFPVSRALPRRVVASTFARSFLIQASWNYHTMLGSGFAFAMLPVLRRLFGSNATEMDASVSRHLEHFNAHPYLSGVALGAAVRLEVDGTDPDTVRRLKMAVRGPLGSLGDALVWTTWLPGVAVGALALYWIGFPGWVVASVFLVIYNVGHVGLRLWGFAVGLEAGREIAKKLAEADITSWTVRMRPVVVGLLGVLVGAVIGADGGLAESGYLWLGLGGVAFVAGLLAGHRAWRPTAALTVAVIAVLASLGMLR